jgi:hypothetical protein
MTPEERQLITGLFDRMRSYGSPEKDREAETIINQSMRAMPDAPYILVQSVLVQEHALQEAGNRIRELEEQVQSLQGAGQARAPGSGSFLGGSPAGGRATLEPSASRATLEPSASNVPQIGPRAAPSTYDERRPWSQSQPPQQPDPAPAAAGGFLRSAMTTAAGVAGGMLAGGAIRDMLGGGHAHANPAAGTSQAARSEQARQDAEDDARQDAAESARQDTEDDARQDAEDNARQDAEDDAGGNSGDSDGDVEV